MDSISSNVIALNVMTGIAAHLISGKTLIFDSLLNLLVKLLELNELKGDTLKSFQEKFMNTILLAINEKPMMGCEMLSPIDAHWRQARPQKGNVEFGGISIIIFGDFGQLPHIGDTSLFLEQITSKGGIPGSVLYRTLFNKHVAVFDAVLRQNQFREVLQHVKNYNMMHDDYKFLKLTEENVDLARFENAITLTSLLGNMHATNIQQLQKQMRHNYCMYYRSTPRPWCQLRSHNDCYLDVVVWLGENCRVMLTQNMNMSLGLTNGAMGFVYIIIYMKNDKNNIPGLPSLRDCIIVQFDKYEGSSFVEGVERLVPIFPETATRTDRHYQNLLRVQYPLVAVYAITMHKSQGETIPMCKIDIGEKGFSAGLTYMAMSRTRHLEDSMFFPRLQFAQQFGLPK